MLLVSHVSLYYVNILNEMNLNFLSIMNVVITLNINIESVDRKLRNICMTSFVSFAGSSEELSVLNRCMTMLSLVSLCNVLTFM